MRTKSLFSICSSLLFCLFIASPALAKSNDPYGDIFIAKSWSDTNNCGPIAALMATKFVQINTSSNNLETNILKVRKSVQLDSESSRWWGMDDLKKYFSQKKVKHTVLTIGKQDHVESNSIKRQLDKNGVVVVNVNMNHLARGGKIGKPYFTFPIPGGWGHFLVVVGYKYVDDELVFEVHDSYVKNGNNRAYYAKDILASIKRYNHEIIAVHQTGQQANRLMAKSPAKKQIPKVNSNHKNSGSIDSMWHELFADNQ